MPDDTFPSPGDPALLPPPPTPPVTGQAWADFANPTEAPRRRFSAIVGALALMFALVAGLLVFSFTRTHGNALALSFREGRSESYRLHMTMDGEASIPGRIQSFPLNMDLAETATWKVLSVDAHGVATVEVSATDVSGTVNGQSMPSPGDFHATMKIASDGRILADSGLGLESTSNSGTYGGFPGAGQVTPLLPNSPVKPGDSWNKHYTQTLPFHMGTLTIDSYDEYLRDETVGGQSAAVIRSDFTMPLNFSINLGEVLSAFRASGATQLNIPRPALQKLSKVTITYSGSMNGTLMSWIDLRAKRMLKSNGRFDAELTATLHGLPARIGSAPHSFTFTGAITEDMAAASRRSQ